MAARVVVGLLVSILALPFAASRSTGSVRGVSVTKQAFYNAEKPFTCFDSSQTIAFSAVNDDFCDCKDGSDEPGTAACPDMTFHCTNAGFRPKDIPSSRVNDGLCDCCDGSDEYDSSVVCFNNCRELGREDRERLAKEKQNHEEGYKTKLEYISRGKQKKTEQLQKIETLNNLLDSRRAELETLKAAKETAEAPAKEAKDKHQAAWEEVKKLKLVAKEESERHEAFSLLDLDKDGSITAQELQTNPFMATDLEHKDALDLLGGADVVDMDAFAAAWNNIRPKFLKDGRPKTVSDAESDHEDPDLEPPEKPESPGETTTAGQPEGESDAHRGPDSAHTNIPGIPRQHDADGNFVAGEDDADDRDVDDHDEDEDDDEDDHEGGVHHDYVRDAAQQRDEDQPDYDEATKKLIEAADEARRQFSEVERQVTDLESEQSKVQAFLKKDFGTEEEFQGVDGQCFEFTDREYTYKLCPFEKFTQRPKAGGSETDLGRWSGWAGADNKYSLMKYENGQGCWNGPARSTMVTVKCGQENSLLSVDEPSRCEYSAVFATPAFCTVLEHPAHDEF